MRLAQGRIEIELHELRRGEGTPLLLLHGLYGSAADWGEGLAAWNGAVYALDFAGHGRSQWIKGGAYTPEILGCDVDAALRHIGRGALVGVGAGAYVALLVAGGRTAQVPAALLLPGAGLAGGGPEPDFERTPSSVIDLVGKRDGCDPLVGALDDDVRPPYYVEPFAKRARQLVLLEDGSRRPPWWQAMRGAGRANIVSDIDDGLAQLATFCALPSGPNR